MSYSFAELEPRPALFKLDQGPRTKDQGLRRRRRRNDAAQPHKDMAAITRFEDIEGWQLARILNQRVWALISAGRFGKDYALSDQINRAAGSAMDNIVEGFDGGSDAEFVRFLRYSQRSCTEVQSQLYRAHDRSHISAQEFDELYALADRVSGKVGALIRYLS